jgi:hypothetical protein
LENAVSALLPAYDRVVAIHNRYVEITDLDDQELHAAGVYIENIRSLHDGCLAAVAESARNQQMRRPSVSWTIENLDRRPSAGSVTPQAITPNVAPITQTLQTEEQQAAGNGKLVHHQQGAQENDGIAADCSESLSGPINTARDEYELAKRQKIDLEFQLKKQELQREREQRDLQLKYDREREDTMLEIRRQSLNRRTCPTRRAAALVHTNNEVRHTANTQHRTNRRPACVRAVTRMA